MGTICSVVVPGLRVIAGCTVGHLCLLGNIWMYPMSSGEHLDAFAWYLYP